MQLIVNNLVTSYSLVGEGPVVVFLHGWGADGENLRSLAPAFPKHQCLLLDLPGFGGSQTPPGAWGVSEYAAFVRAALQKLDIEHVRAVCGHSFGGRIALELVGSGGLVPDKLILLSSHGLPEPKTNKTRLTELLARLSRPLPKRWRRAVGARLASADYAATSGVMRDVFKKVIVQNVKETARQITVPTLLVYGQDDEVTPVAFGQQLAQIITGAQLSIIPAAGHYVYLDQPKLVKQQIGAFL
jgi:pimeloyl-ACP methyl ester carboxylesterase